MHNDSKSCYIIAGPNGAGKTTFAMDLLPNEVACNNFINADLIAAGLSPFQPDLAAIEAGKLMLKKLIIALMVVIPSLSKQHQAVKVIYLK